MPNSRLGLNIDRGGAITFRPDTSTNTEQNLNQ
jgi:hypothetical protein